MFWDAIWGAEEPLGAVSFSSARTPAHAFALQRMHARAHPRMHVGTYASKQLRGHAQAHTLTKGLWRRREIAERERERDREREREKERKRGREKEINRARETARTNERDTERKR